MAVQIEAYNKQYGTKYNYITPCNLYSEYDNFENDRKMHFITALLKKIKTCTGELNLLGTGKPLRQFMYAGDLASIIKLTIEKDITENFNVAYPENHSINDLAKWTTGTDARQAAALAAATRRRHELRATGARRPPHRQPRLLASLSVLQMAAAL